MNKHILALGKECLRLVKSDKPTFSFLGGKPITASDIDWPRKNSKPLGFIAQFDLNEINNKEKIAWLPREGRLLFFYDLDEFPWGFHPKDKGGWAVIYENGNHKLQELELPGDLSDECIVPSTKYISVQEFISYPDAQKINLEDVGLTESDDEKYWDFIDENYGEEPRHQIGGYPSPVQNDEMEEECQLVSGGVNCGNSIGYATKKAEELRKQKNDWLLLFQFDSDDDVEVMWGDMGMLYFWVRESEAKKCDFSESWMILQCG